MKMKKFLLWATVVGASFTSCVNDNEAVLTSEDNPQSITFEVAKYKPSSRAEEEAQNATEPGVFPITQTFGTFAYEQLEGAGNNTYSVFMDNIEIKHYANSNMNQGLGYWAAKTNQYDYIWPQNAHLDFISYAPYEAYTITDGNKSLSSAVPVITSSSTASHNDILSYVDYEIIQGKDLLYSNKAVNQIANTMHYGFSGVPTLFHHALAKLNFKIKMDADVSEDGLTSWAITVHSLKINNVYTKGTLVLKTDNLHNQAKKDREWINQAISSTQPYNVWGSVTTPFAADCNWNENKELTTTAQSYGSPLNGYFIIPQNLTNQSFTITYTLRTTNQVVTTDGSGASSTTTTGVTEVLTKTVPFNKFTSVKAWEMGKNIVYTISINPAGDVINFAPAAYDWEDIEGVLSI